MFYFSPSACIILLQSELIFEISVFQVSLIFLAHARNARIMLLFIINLTHLIGSTRSEVECIEESGTPVDDKYCKPIPRPDDRQKTCNEDPCPPTWVNSGLLGGRVVFDNLEQSWFSLGNKIEEYGVATTSQTRMRMACVFVVCSTKIIEHVEWIQLISLEDY